MLKNSAATFRYLTRKSTIHGMSHIYQSKSRVRQTFWFVLLLCGFVLGLYHTIHLVDEYLQKPVTSNLKIDEEEAVFPYITICNHKPVSDNRERSIFMRKYKESYWNNFTNWNVKLLNSTGDTQGIYQKMFNILWVSADLRDLGDSDRTIILSCKFNDNTCDHRHFSLIQIYRYQNCYTFNPSAFNGTTSIGGRGDDLEILAFAENQIPPTSKTLGQLNVNNILMTNDGAYSGLRVFFHEKTAYPLFAKDFLDLQPGKSSTITLRPIRYSLMSRKHHKCSNQPLEKVRYVAYFAFGSQNVTTREYDKAKSDFVAEAKQKMMYDRCGCYSHLYPFQVNTSQLCYYVAPQHWINPPANIMHNIECHDAFITETKKKALNLIQQFQEKSLCQFTRFRPEIYSLNWPNYEHIEDIWQDLIVPKIEFGNEFFETDGHRHHIFNTSRDYSKLLFGESREKMTFLPFILSSDACFEHFYTLVCKNFSHFDFGCLTKLLPELRSEYKTNGRCVTRAILARNLLRLRIRMQNSLSADVFSERYSFHWTEALSEIGGIFGLWLGVSLLIVLELLDMGYLMVMSCVKNRAFDGTEQIETSTSSFMIGSEVPLS